MQCMILGGWKFQTLGYELFTNAATSCLIYCLLSASVRTLDLVTL